MSSSQSPPHSTGEPGSHGRLGRAVCTYPAMQKRAGRCSGACIGALQRHFAALRGHVRAEVHAEQLVADAAGLRLLVERFLG